MSNEDNSKFKTYDGVSFLSAKFPKREWLIENIIRERDTVLFVGDEKAGKSLAMKQMICSLTTQHPFFDKYNVTKLCRVSYLQLEGELEDTRDHIDKMARSVDFGPELFQIIYSPSLNLEDHDVAKELVREVQKHGTPDILIIDPLYMAMVSSLSEDAGVRMFFANIRWMKGVLKCAIVIVHHTHKMRRSRDGVTINEGDEAAFGSRFLKAYPDSTIMFLYDKKTEQRTMVCQTQRSGDIVPSITLNLVEPDPLYFEEAVSKAALTSEIDIYDLLKEHPEGLDRKTIELTLKISQSTFYLSLKKLGDKIEKKGKPMVYKVVGK